MRLLHAGTIKFHEFHDSSTPSYAILSHRWEDEEVSYQELRDAVPAVRRKKGFLKIRQCCQQAMNDGLKYVWVDTCCIDKSSSAELSEAINSMYTWYQRSVACYAFLSDVYRNIEDSDGHWITENPDLVQEVMNSRWWTRGWTLQELIAPLAVVFHITGARGWIKIGSKSSLLELVAARTGIDAAILRGLDVRERSVAQRMSWASERETTRTEDTAYCLLGIFGVNMPLLYGEGSKAFIRLQKEIMKQSDDQTLFAWQLGYDNYEDDICGPLATHPSKFRYAKNLVPIPDSESQAPYSMTNKGLRIDLPIVHRDEEKYGVAYLHCSTAESFPKQIGLPVVRLGAPGSSRYARDASCVGPLDSFKAKSTTSVRSIFMKQEPTQNTAWRTGLIARVPTGDDSFYRPTAWNAYVSTSDNEAQTWYLIPASCRRGAILFTGKDRSNLLVLFNIDMQHIGRYACKVMYSPPSWSLRKLKPPMPWQEPIQRVADIMETAYKYNLNNGGIAYRTDDPYRSDVFTHLVAKESSWSLLYGDLETSNSRRSFEFLPNNRAVYAEIGQQVIRGQTTMVLDVEVQDHSTELCRPYELDGTSNAPDDQEVVPHIDEITNYGPEPELERGPLESRNSWMNRLGLRSFQAKPLVGLHVEKPTLPPE